MARKQKDILTIKTLSKPLIAFQVSNPRVLLIDCLSLSILSFELSNSGPPIDGADY